MKQLELFNQMLKKDEDAWTVFPKVGYETYHFHRIFSISVNSEKTAFIFTDGSDGAFETTLNKIEYITLIEELIELMNT